MDIISAFMLNIKLSIISILYLLAAAQGLLLCGALLTSHKGLKKANRFLAALVFVFTLDMVSFFLEEIDTTKWWLLFDLFIFPREFFYGVFFYFYTRELTCPGQYFIRGYQWLHFFPSLIFVASVWSIFLLDTQTIIALINTDAQPTGWFLTVAIIVGIMETPLTYCHVAAYFFISYRLLIQHQNKIKDNFSFTEKINLQWLKTLIFSLLCIYCLWLLNNFLPDWLIPEFSIDNMLGLSIVVLIYFVGYMGLRQPIIFSGMGDQPIAQLQAEAVEPVIDADKNEAAPTRSLLIDQSQQTQLLETLEKTLKSEEYYLKNDLSLADLAQAMEISTHYLSEVINVKAGVNFYEYINRYRVNYAQDLLKDKTRKLTVLEVAMQSGFNSKSAFYTAFKKQLGMTPTQYKSSSKE